MMRHETPSDVAMALAKWAPPTAKTFLDPSVGNGSLIIPFIKQLEKPNCSATLIDIDPIAIRGLRATVAGGNIEYRSRDFLSVNFRKKKFDCIVMNPPFSAKSEHLAIERDKNGAEPVKLSIEILFLKKALGLLAKKGRILAILPASVISGMIGMRLRQEILAGYKVLNVHELPESTFKNCEVRVYFLIIEANAPASSVLLCNHNLINPEKIFRKINALGVENRLDFSYQNALVHMNGAILGRNKDEWITLSDLALVQRGSVTSPSPRGQAIHTTNFKDGFWNVDGIARGARGSPVGKSTLLMVRVGRSAGTSVGPLKSARHKVDATDCIFVIQPNSKINRDALLLALRVVLASEVGQNFIQRGTCAKYIRHSDIVKLELPYGHVLKDQARLNNYSACIRRFDLEGMVKIERAMRGKFDFLT